MTLKAYLAISLAVMITSGGAALGSPKTWSSLTPSNGTPVTIESKKSKQDYYAFSKSTPSTVKVTGPGRLRVVTRAVLPGKKKEGIYGFVVIRDGEDRQLLSKTTKKAGAKLLSAPSTRLGKPKSVTLKVPAGDHEYQVSLPNDAKHDCFVRFQFTESKGKKKAKDKTEYVAYLPRKFAEEVKIQVKEQEFICYRASSDKPVELEVNGPTNLKVVARLEFDHTMRGDKPFRVQVMEDNNIVQTNPFNGKISATAAYSKPSDKVIGRGNSFFVAVPEGKHRYLVTTPDKGNTVLLRFYMPQKDLGIESKSGKTGSAVMPTKRTKHVNNG